MSKFIPKDSTNTKQHELMRLVKKDPFMSALLNNLPEASRKKVEHHLLSNMGMLTSGVSKAATEKLVQEDTDGIG